MKKKKKKRHLEQDEPISIDQEGQSKIVGRSKLDLSMVCRFYSPSRRQEEKKEETQAR